MIPIRESTVYLNTANDTASSSDYDALKNYKVDFKIFQTTQNVTVTTTKDTSDEGNESFKLNLYKSLADSNSGDNLLLIQLDILKMWLLHPMIILLHQTQEHLMRQLMKVKSLHLQLRSGSGTASKVYVSTNNKSAVQGDDFEGFLR